VDTGRFDGHEEYEISINDDRNAKACVAGDDNLPEDPVPAYSSRCLLFEYPHDFRHRQSCEKDEAPSIWYLEPSVPTRVL
jgi:hypothetical protein